MTYTGTNNKLKLNSKSLVIFYFIGSNQIKSNQIKSNFINKYINNLYIQYYPLIAKLIEADRRMKLK